MADNQKSMWLDTDAIARIADQIVPGQAYTYAQDPRAYNVRKNRKTGNPERGAFSERRMVHAFFEDTLPGYTAPDENKWGRPVE